MKDLTSRQQQILNYIKDHLSLTGFPPTRSDIANEMGFKSPNAAEDHLRALARKGAIEIVPGTSRGIRLPINEQLGLPIIGQVAAGFPILAEESISGYSEVPSNFFTPSAKIGNPAATCPIIGNPNCSLIGRRIPLDVPGTISIAPLRARALRWSSAALGDLNPISFAISDRVGGKPVRLRWSLM